MSLPLDLFMMAEIVGRCSAASGVQRGYIYNGEVDDGRIIGGEGIKRWQ